MDKLVPIPSRGLLPERDIDKPPILDIHGLGIEFGGLHAVEDFTLVMGRTEITGLIGPNGAGKTTLIKKLIAEAYAGEKLVLIENEFGEINIDSGFLKESGIEISEMSAGCICCSLVGLSLIHI